jgi:hypothetical protein
MAVGSEYNRLLANFLVMGGNLSDCPFDTKDYKYAGPEIENNEMIQN